VRVTFFVFCSFRSFFKKGLNLIHNICSCWRASNSSSYPWSQFSTHSRRSPLTASAPIGRKTWSERAREKMLSAESVCRRLRWSWFTTSAGHKNGAAGWEISSLVACSISLSTRAYYICSKSRQHVHIPIYTYTCVYIESSTAPWIGGGVISSSQPIHLSRRLLLSHSLSVGFSNRKWCPAGSARKKGISTCLWGSSRWLPCADIWSQGQIARVITSWMELLFSHIYTRVRGGVRERFCCPCTNWAFQRLFAKNCWVILPT
jgi:hypothetical protein